MNNEPRQVLLLCAGLGTRLRPWTDNIAKSAIPFLNLPLCLHPLLLFNNPESIKKTVFNTHYLPETVNDVFRNYFSDNSTQESFEPEILDSGGGIKQASRFMSKGESFLVCNGDEVILPKQPDALSRFWSSHLASDALVTILTIRHPEAGIKYGGVWCDNSSYVKGFGRKPIRDAYPLHYIGVLAVRPEAIDLMNKDKFNIFYDFCTDLIRTKPDSVRSVCIEAEWFETGTIEDFENSTESVLTHAFSGNYPHWVENLEKMKSKFGNESV